MRRRSALPSLLVASTLFFTLGALTGLQATGSIAGPRLLGRLAAALFELDRWTPAHIEDIQAAARGRIRGPVEVTGLPVRVAVPLNAASDGDADSLQEALASAAGRELYEHGQDAFLDGEDAAGGLAVTDPVRWAIGLLEREDHQWWKIAAAVGVIGVMLSTGLVLLASPAGVTSLLGATLVGGLGFAMASLAGWLLMQLAADAATSPMNKELASIAGDCAWLGFRLGAATGLAGLALLLMLQLFGQQSRRYANWSGHLDEAA